jgi:hypothetical protein
MYMRKLWLWSFLLLAFLVCKPVSSVEAAQYEFVLVAPVENPDLSYTDENIVLRFTYPLSDIKQIGFEVYNKTTEPIILDWSKAAFIAPDGTYERVYHYNVGYVVVDGGGALSPSFIAPKSKLSDCVSRTRQIKWNSYSHEWSEDAMFPSLYQDAEAYKNKTFSIFLPIEANGKNKYYKFTFLVREVTQKWVPKSSLGIKYSDQNTIALDKPATKIENGIYVVSFEKGSSAAIAGILVGDTITNIAGNPITSSAAFIETMGKYKVGEVVDVTVLRNGETKVMKVTLGQSPKP